MQALVLAGGEGTRLRPLTSTMPKPVVPLVDRPFLGFMLAWLRRHGVDRVVLSCGYLASGVSSVLRDGAEFGISLEYVEEPEPLGTGGAIKYAADRLDERFLCLNGDVLTDMDLTAQLGRHEAMGARATLALIPVDDPSAYGLVRAGEDGRVAAFLEKPEPQEIDTNLVNAGAYVLERSVLDVMPPSGPCSIERDVFPKLIGDGLAAYAHEAYWLDIGTPQRYLEGTWAILEGEVEAPEVARIGVGVEVAGDAEVGERVVLGAGARVGARSVVQESVVLRGGRVGADCRLERCILAPGVRVGDGARVEPGAVLGAEARVAPGALVAAGARVAPGAEVPAG